MVLGGFFPPDVGFLYIRVVLAVFVFACSLGGPRLGEWCRGGFVSMFLVLVFFALGGAVGRRCRGRGRMERYGTYIFI